jgi:hypothetical protein
MPRRADEVVVIFWRDIPAQVTARRGADRVQTVLPRRFQRAIDEAAMRAGKKSASDYVGEWRREAQPLAADIDPQAQVDAIVRELDERFTRDALARYVDALGYTPGDDRA